jgi:hypothetical protein
MQEDGNPFPHHAPLNTSEHIPGAHIPELEESEDPMSGQSLSLSR